MPELLIRRYKRPQSVQEAWEPWAKATGITFGRLRLQIAGLILGQRLCELQRDLWKAIGERDAWAETVRSEVGSDDGSTYGRQ